MATGSKRSARKRSITPRRDPAGTAPAPQSPLLDLTSDWYWEQDAEFRFTTFEGRGGGGHYAPSAAVLGKRM